MEYTYKSLALVWLILAALFAMSGAGVMTGPWPLLFVVAALATPFLLRARSNVVPAAVRSPDAVRGPGRLSSNPESVHVHRWEDDGGAARTNVVGTREAAHAARQRGPRLSTTQPSG